MRCSSASTPAPRRSRFRRPRVGLRPREDDILEVFPLLPAGTWPWFCLDGASYRGRNVSILWDKDGKKYGLGPGLQVWIDGRRVARSDRLERLLVPLP